MLPLSYSWIIRKHLSGMKTVLDVGCGDGYQMKEINNDNIFKVTGIDLYKPYLVEAKKTGVYTKVLLGDIRKLHISPKSYDAVISSQVVEHLTKKESLSLIKEMEKIAKKKVIVATTNGFFPFDPIEGKDENPLQVHKSGWEVNEMRSYGYKVYGQSLGIVYKPDGLGHKLKNTTLKSFFYGVSYFFAVFTYFFPSISTYIIAIKQK